MAESSNRRSRTIGRRALRRTRTLVSIFIFAAALSSSCQRSESEEGHALPSSGQARELGGGSPVIQPQGLGQVRLEIENRQPMKLRLFRILGNDRIPIERPIESEARLEVDSGFYLLRSDDRSVQCPVPAIAPLVPNRRISIQVEPVPQPEPGWCWIPPGPAVIGDTLGVGREDERPARIVNLPGFWMGETEVTNHQFADFLSSQKMIDETWIDLRSRKCLIQKNAEGKFVPDSTIADAAEMPVVMVSLSGALAYCDWLSAESGQAIRLPSEQEWEKSARGPESYIYSYGNIYQQSQANQESGKLKPVGSYQPNSFGLWDMTGNVFEWMSGRADFTNMETTLNHSLRGGSFVLDGMYLRNSFRMRQSPTVMTDDIGFRVARDAQSKTDTGKTGK